MKILRYTYLLVLAAMTAVMAACSSDDDSSNSNSQQPMEGMAQVTLHVSPAHSPAVTRWTDGNATDDEMMNIWVVVITDNSDVVEKVLVCKPTGQEREIDAIASLPTGPHHFYSFANMSVATVATMLGITVTMPTMSDNDVVYEATAVSGTVDADKAVTVGGNGFAAMTSSDDNGFGSYGIPMSNVQSVTITGSTTLDLIVVRMLAKMVIQLYNETGSAVTVQSVTLSDLTYNPTLSDDPANLKLLPNLTEGANTMNYIHKDIQPNLNGTPTKVDYTYEVPSAKQTVETATYASGTPAQTLTFYVNESATPSNAEHLFYLTLKMSDTEYRYALINQTGKDTDDDNAWDYIARNDYRIIPIVIDDYKLELIPYDFPPIGVYPASVREIEDDLYEMTFHDYGHFHLVPKVTKISIGDVVPFGSAEGTGPYWTLQDGATDAAKWAASWKTAATKGGAWLDADGITANGFYRNQTATVDGDDAGGVPVWYANTSSPLWDPQWDPDGDNTDPTYYPFIFGYIADPGDTWWETTPANRADKQIYHEFRVKLYVGGDYRRDLLYRFYMTLSKDQMLGARSAAPLPSEGRGRGGVVRRPHNSPHE